VLTISLVTDALSGYGLNSLSTPRRNGPGIGVPLIVTSVLDARAKEVMIGRISRATERLQRLSGFVLVAVGIYLIYYNYVYLV